jgi:hypothetical protein
MTLRASPSWACSRVSRSRSLAGVRPGLAGRSATPPRVHRGLRAMRIPIVPRALLLADVGRRAFGLLDGHLLDEWLARGGVSGSSTLKSVLMRSRACLPNSRARSPRANASPAIEARSNRTVRYSSASLASSLSAWASCVLMSVPLGGEGGGALGPAAVRGPVPRHEEPLRHRHPPRRRRLLGRW